MLSEEVRGVGQRLNSNISFSQPSDTSHPFRLLGWRGRSAFSFQQKPLGKAMSILPRLKDDAAKTFWPLHPSHL
jgi:hypothetical protein